jgi:hypothetical protein
MEAFSTIAAREDLFMVNIPSLRHLRIFVILLAFLAIGLADDVGRPSEKDGTLVVLVTWGDVDNTPANDVYVEAYGFVRTYGSEKSFVLKMAHAGRYEAALPPGVYDVFVSEGTSIPRCRRVLVTAGYTGYWTLKLEHDDVYLQR